MKKEELTNLFMEFIEDQFPELTEEKDVFNYRDLYYYIHPNGEVFNDYWNICQLDKERLSIGNAFKTREEAEFAVEKLKVLHELEELGRPYRLGAENYFITLYRGVELTIGADYSYQSCYFGVYFDTSEEAQEAIDKIGEDRIKKYLFGVK
ncbi:hypothetical protein [Facklamia hominis]